ncbi:MAG: F0F1 ATP synthase subunit A [Patescibacteria group bacterium]|nr:F0F1 ATP synthase subunit A [Patescibacteria group bacterium]
MLAVPPLAAEQILHIGPLPVTNSYVNSTIALVGFVVFALFIRAGVKKYGGRAPKGIVNFFESILEFILGYIDNVTHDRKKSLKFLPIVGSLFLFILISNWMGLLPGVGSIGIQKGSEFIPLLRPANTDLNMTLSMAVLAVVASHILGVATIGFFKYANRFIKIGDLYHAFKSLKPVNILTAIIEFFVGLIEIISEIAKMVSLSLRLLGNIFAGEVLMTVLAGLVPYLVPLPFMALELLVGFIQAVVFAMLALVYLSMATVETHGHAEAGKGEAEAEAEENQVPAV